MTCRALTPRGECRRRPTVKVFLVLGDRTPAPMCGPCSKTYRQVHDRRGGTWGGSRIMPDQAAPSRRLVTVEDIRLNDFGLMEIVYSDGSTQTL